MPFPLQSIQVLAAGIEWVVEHVEELRLELSLDRLSDGEVLEDGHVRHELARPSELIALDVAERRNLEDGVNGPLAAPRWCASGATGVKYVTCLV